MRYQNRVTARLQEAFMPSAKPKPVEDEWAEIAAQCVELMRTKQAVLDLEAAFDAVIREIQDKKAQMKQLCAMESKRRGGDDGVEGGNGAAGSRNDTGVDLGDFNDATLAMLELEKQRLFEAKALEMEAEAGEGKLLGDNLLCTAPWESEPFFQPDLRHGRSNYNLLKARLARKMIEDKMACLKNNNVAVRMFRDRVSTIVQMRIKASEISERDFLRENRTEAPQLSKEEVFRRKQKRHRDAHKRMEEVLARAEETEQGKLCDMLDRMRSKNLRKLIREEQQRSRRRHDAFLAVCELMHCLVAPHTLIEFVKYQKALREKYESVRKWANKLLPSASGTQRPCCRASSGGAPCSFGSGARRRTS